MKAYIILRSSVGKINQGNNNNGYKNNSSSSEAAKMREAKRKRGEEGEKKSNKDNRANIYAVAVKKFGARLVVAFAFLFNCYYCCFPIIFFLARNV